MRTKITIEADLNAIQLWKFTSAPEEYKRVAIATDYNEDWLLFAKDKAPKADLQEIIESIKNHSRVNTHLMSNGIVYITYR